MQQGIGIVKRKNPHGVRVIPGFGLTFGVSVTMLACLVLIPLASIVWSAARLSFSEFIQVVTSRQIMSGYQVSLSCAFWAALVNVIFGIILAWVLVRYEFPGKRILDGMIELPFALPTAVAGIALTTLYSDQGWVGALFAKAGIKIAYTKAGITIAMIFVGIPFVVRSVQPVLEKLDRGYEEAAMMLGAGRIRTFFKVILPELYPAALAGFGLAAAYAMIGGGFRAGRITSWLDIENSEGGYQILQGLYAIASGGITGSGLGQSMQKLGYIPEAYNDMIFAVICEELGIVGAVLVMGAFLVLLWRIVMIACNAPDIFGSMICVGSMIHIAIQVLFNIAVVTNTIPSTGVPLPLISYGGTACAIMMLELGLVLGVSRQIKLK